MRAKSILLCLLTAIVAIFLTLGAAAQSLVSGDITGVVVDPSGAVIPNATVTLQNNGTGQTQTATTSGSGLYRFSLLSPGQYTISAASSGFQKSERAVTVAVGQATTVNLQMAVGTSSTSVEVTAEGGVVQTQNGNLSTTFTPQQVQMVPNPGNDLSYIVQTAPGAVMNTQAGYGNSSTYGLPATSNLFTVDGMDENDPFLNLNNSGATNLLLGANDVETATVVNNGYTGEYGGMAGANVNYVTKQGTNKYHGNAEYFWNGSVLNANDYFNNATGTARPFDNANQWAASLGGPIIKDKTFFFVNTEGLRLVFPTNSAVNVPSPQFEAATLANLGSNGNAGEVPFYNQIFSVYNNAADYPRATNSLPGGGCDGGVALAGGSPCALQFRSAATNQTNEWLLTARVDQNISNTDRAFLHFRMDRGLQATFTDPLTPVLNAVSNQPQYEGQFQENHSFSSQSVNQFILSGSWYSAIFKPANINSAIALMPFQLNFGGGEFATPGGTNYSTWPQGRNATQYQIEDDYSWQRNKHAIKFGVNFHRNDITDYTPGGFNATIPTANFADLGSFFNGTADTFVQGFANRPTEPLAVYGLGLYAQDEWAATRDLKVTLALRAEHNSDPVCQTDCFSRLDNSFMSISHDPTQPYNQAIQSGLHQALPGYQSIAWEPRLGFAWQPFGSANTVIRGGIGLFADIFPATVATNFDTNSPVKNTFVASGLDLAPGLPGSAQTAAMAANSAFVSGFSAGQNIGQIIAGPSGSLFSPPAFFNAAHHIKYPSYQEWNLELQQGLGSKMSVSVNYVGNHGSDLALANPGLNAYCNGPTTPVPFQPAGVTDCQTSLGITGFTGLPVLPTDPRFSTITEISNPGVSNYNGLTVEFTRHFSALELQVNYTWSHALDDISNGGILPFNFLTNTSILSPQDPFALRPTNYGNADYDVRHQLSLNYVYTTPREHGALGALLNWTISGTLFARTGLPFTAFDGASTGALGSFNYGPALGLSMFTNANVGPIACNSSAITTPCMTSSEFASAVVPGALASFGTERRNQLYGPRFFDTDLTVMKDFPVPHWEGAQFEIGAQAFNILNHPNFDQPQGDFSNPQFGNILGTVGTPTSIFGSFLGGNSSPRALQIRAQLRF